MIDQSQQPAVIGTLFGGGAQKEITSLAELAQAINSFYGTVDEAARRECESMLNRFQQKPESWRLIVELVRPTNNFPSHVQFYGARVLYTWASARFDQLAESTENTDAIQAFLVQSLSSGAMTFTHSVLNKLSSVLAIFMLKCTPDIWPNAFKELIDAWGPEQPELLLRIFTEVATEYPKMGGGVKIRGVVKAELAKVSSELVRLSREALMDPTAPASLKNASVECIEMWLKLPGVKLEEFMDVFTHVFHNITNDTGALSRILGTLKANEEMTKHPQLVHQISTYLATSACPMILTRLTAILSVPSNMEEGQMDEMTPLIVSVTEFVSEFLNQIIANAASSFGNVAIRDQSYASVYLSLCDFFLQLSTVKGIYPVQENISDLAEPFWSELKEQLVHIDSNKAYAENKKLIAAESAKYYLQLLSSAIEKIAYVPNIDKVLGKAELELFEAYRTTRGDVSSNAMQIAAMETSALLASALDAYLRQQNISGAEATLYYIREACNFFRDKSFIAIVPTLCNCGAPTSWMGANQGSVSSEDYKRYGFTLMELLRKVEHLLLTVEGAREFLPTIVNIVLAFLQCPDVDSEAIETLTKLMENRDSAIQVVLEPIVSSCFAYYSDKQKLPSSRIAAIKCVGRGLSFKPLDYVTSNLDRIVAPSLITIQSTLSGTGTQRQKEAVILFELSVIEQLVSTLEAERRSQSDTITAYSPTDAPTPVRLIMDECVKLFNTIFASGTFSGEMVRKICDVLKAGINTLYTSMAPLLPSYMFYLDNLLPHYPEPACALAKAVYLTFRSSNEATPFLVKKLAQWFLEQSKKYTSGTPFTIGDQEEYLQDLAYQVVKKNWAVLVDAVSLSAECAADVQSFLQSSLFVCVNIVAHGKDASMVRESFTTIVTVVKNCLTIDKLPLRQSLENMAEQIITVVYRRIGSELVSMYTPHIAEILFLFAKSYPSQTRAIVTKLPGGESQAVSDMFAQVSIKNFRLRVAQMHGAVMKEKGT